MAIAGTSRRAVPGFLVLLLVAPGCQAYRGASLAYPPPGDPAAAAPPPAPPPDAPAVALRSVTDERAGKRDVVGAYERVPQAEMPVIRRDLVTTDDAPAWVRGAIRRELQLAGLSVVEPGSAGDAPAIDAAIRKLSCEASEDSRIYAGRMELHAALRAPGGVLLDQVYRGRHDLALPIGLDVTDEGITACLAGALRDAARRVAADAARVLRAQAPAAAPAQP